MQTIKKSEDITKVLKEGKIINKPFFKVFYRKNDLSFPRFAFIAPKKVFKKAVLRNRARRLMREAVRLNFDLFKDLSYDIIFIARFDIIGLKLQNILQDIKDIPILLQNEKNFN
ncbi:ribonuclease P protein component [Venenivibrio stagnispumantis]|uniref:Ribonuclease P protein component n=1 Tax=Venenivibrio stagnispumantis TaxID=407998 RepID=A0AA45WJB0_9AQUI|nr:ribonuclease P protein component [Venenivibrio stagnispumantis]MCW4572460.1 ribonuclease P protein component [Venenivibrio stagnispumantis]SMP02651.1 ribonuclease P protein component [Venenivibrio stagnispumantis]